VHDATTVGARQREHVLARSTRRLGGGHDASIVNDFPAATLLRYAGLLFIGRKP